MSSSPDKLLLNESRSSPSAAGLIGTIEGHLLINGAVILLSSSSSRSRAVHDLGPRRASQHFRAGMAAAGGQLLRSLAATRNPHRGASSATGSTSMVDFLVYLFV